MVALRQVVDERASEAKDLELVRRARAGDVAAFRALYVEHFPVVSRMARRLGTPPVEVDDVTQEVFEKAFRKLDRFRGGNFGYWIHRICANVVTDQHRRRRVRETLGKLWGRKQEEEATVEPPDLEREPDAFVARVLARMKPKHREVFALFELEGISGEEIAERVSCPLNTVWTRLFHARKEFARHGRRILNFESQGETP